MPTTACPLLALPPAHLNLLPFPCPAHGVLLHLLLACVSLVPPSAHSARHSLALLTGLPYPSLALTARSPVPPTTRPYCPLACIACLYRPLACTARCSPVSFACSYRPPELSARLHCPLLVGTVRLPVPPATGLYHHILVACSYLLVA